MEPSRPTDCLLSKGNGTIPGTQRCRLPGHGLTPREGDNTNKLKKSNGQPVVKRGPEGRYPENVAIRRKGPEGDHSHAFGVPNNVPHRPERGGRRKQANLAGASRKDRLGYSGPGGG